MIYQMQDGAVVRGYLAGIPQLPTISPKSWAGSAGDGGQTVACLLQRIWRSQV